MQGRTEQGSAFSEGRTVNYNVVVGRARPIVTTTFLAGDLGVFLAEDGVVFAKASAKLGTYFLVLEVLISSSFGFFSS